MVVERHYGYVVVEMVVAVMIMLPRVAAAHGLRRSQDRGSFDEQGGRKNHYLDKAGQTTLI